MAKASFISGLKQTGPNRFMHFNCRANNLSTDVIYLHLANL